MIRNMEYYFPKSIFVLFICLITCNVLPARRKVPQKPRILISSDIGGTDPDDNQSMIHFLMFSDEFDTEGIISSPSFGNGNKKEIIRMIDVYEKDYPILKKQYKHLSKPSYLRSITKQGRHGAMPFCGYSEPTEGSQWIIKCAKKYDRRPLWVLVWGGLEDLAQALHDAPDIAHNIHVYWIGGPNKKWSINAYSYIVNKFPYLWFIENNTSYRGFTAQAKIADKYNAGFYDEYMKGAGLIGTDFINYYAGLPKLGDTPSLLYMMDGDPENPMRESWGGSFTPISYSPRNIFYHKTSDSDTVAVNAVMEFHVKGPILEDVTQDSVCITLNVDKQKWSGYYLGNGDYAVRYSTYKVGRHDYVIDSNIPDLESQKGSFVVANIWPGTHRKSDYILGATWYSDSQDSSLFWNGNQGAASTYKWRNKVLQEWGTRLRSISMHHHSLHSKKH